MTTTVIIRLEIEGSGDAFAVVDDLLDEGLLQDAINERDEDLFVVSAVCQAPEDES